MTDTVRAVLFDWGGTLTPWHTVDVAAGWIAVAGAVDAARAQELSARLAVAEQEVWIRSRDEHRSATLDEVFAVAGTAPTEAALRVYEQVWDPHSRTDPDAAQVLGALRDRG